MIEISCTSPSISRSVWNLKVHPLNSDLLFSASKDESVRLWNVQIGVPVIIFAGDEGHRDEVISLDIHSLGNAFASSGMDRNIRVWSLDSNTVCDAIKASYTHTDKKPYKVFTDWDLQL